MSYWEPEPEQISLYPEPEGWHPYPEGGIIRRKITTTTTAVTKTEVPTTAPPTTSIPTSLAPTTIGATSAVPTTVAPTTTPPTTILPTSPAPTTPLFCNCDSLVTCVCPDLPTNSTFSELCPGQGSLENFICEFAYNSTCDASLSQQQAPNGPGSEVTIPFCFAFGCFYNILVCP